ncbi:MAG TPA: UrcA family protein [Steroidobacteraceae bacterium]|jgi:UrcA family protein|nr:UrcA family protein [Steroidobacteraceae bacterium]
MNTTTPSIRLRGLIATAIFSALASSFAAVCAAADGTVSETVKYEDLNVSNPQGAATLYRRIAKAADDVCGSYHVDSRNLESKASLNACIHKAIADAVTKVGQPQLFAIYNSKNRQPLPVTVASVQRH